MIQNGKTTIDMANLNTKVLYASNFFVASDQGYTKHFFAGSERVCSKIGGGLDDALVDPIETTVEVLYEDYEQIPQHLYELLNKFANCTPYEETVYINYDTYLAGIEDFLDRDDPEEDRFFYHPDHLGSSSFITDASGAACEHLQYMPFGETFVSQKASWWSTPYQFSAKEKDDETGFNYFGARYYNSGISIWLSVDPLSDEFSGITPYNYCLQNPIMNIDPDGMNDELVITGIEADKAIEQLQSTTTMTLTRDPKTGKVTATGEAKTEDDKRLLAAIQNTDISIEIDANNISGAGEFHGANYNSNNYAVTVNYRVNPLKMEEHEKSCKRWPWQKDVPTGTGILHEITEGFIIGNRALIEKNNIEKAWRTYETEFFLLPNGSNKEVQREVLSPDYYKYQQAHNSATPAPEDWHKSQRTQKRNDRKSKRSKQ